MSQSLDFEIRERLAQYLASKISLRDFEDWFFPETWDVDEINDMALTNLVYGIKLRLAEFSNGDWTEAELHSLLRSLMEKHEINMPQHYIQFGTSNLSYHSTPSVTYSVQCVDIKPVKVSL